MSGLLITLPGAAAKRPERLFSGGVDKRRMTEHIMEQAPPEEAFDRVMPLAYRPVGGGVGASALERGRMF